MANIDFRLLERREQQLTIDVMREFYAAVAESRGYSADRADEIAQIALNTIDAISSTTTLVTGEPVGRVVDDEKMREMIIAAAQDVLGVCIDQFIRAVPDLAWPMND